MRFQSRTPAKPDRRPVSFAGAFEPGPVIVAVPFRQSSSGKARSLLSLRERTALAEISASVTVRKGTQIYREGDAAEFVYIITNGYVKTWRSLPNGTTRVISFPSAGDLLGLAAEGRHVESARAIATTTAYRVPLEALETLLSTDTSLSLRLLCKLANIVVAQQRQAMILGRNDALGKLAMFLHMLEQLQRERGWDTEIIYLPMSRSDIADYVGLSEAAVSRALTALHEQGVVSFRTKRQLHLTNRPRLQELIGCRRSGRSVSARTKR